MANEKELIKQIHDLIVKEYPEIAPVEFSLELSIDRYERGKYVGRAGRMVLTRSREHSVVSDVMDKLFKYYQTVIETH